jgi:hypothetical protein
VKHCYVVWFDAERRAHCVSRVHAFYLDNAVMTLQGTVTPELVEDTLEVDVPDPVDELTIDEKGTEFAVRFREAMRKGRPR